MDSNKSIQFDYLYTDKYYHISAQSLGEYSFKIEVKKSNSLDLFEEVFNLSNLKQENQSFTVFLDDGELLASLEENLRLKHLKLVEIDSYCEIKFEEKILKRIVEFSLKLKKISILTKEDLDDCNKDNLTRIFDSLFAKITSLEQDISFLKTHVKSLDSQNNILQSQITLCKDENVYLKNQIQTLESKNLAYCQRLDSAEQQLNNVQPIFMDGEYYLLKQWLPFKFKLVLLYKASIHGFEGKDFHDKADGYENILTVITTKNLRRFGGFTPIKFVSSGGYQEDSSLHSFLFSFYWKTKFQLKHDKKHLAIYDHINCGPTYGDGKDLYVADKSNANDFSSSDLLSSYENKDFNFKKHSDEARKILAGSFQFKIHEIEAYQVIKI